MAVANVNPVSRSVASVIVEERNRVKSTLDLLIVKVGDKLMSPSYNGGRMIIQTAELRNCLKTASQKFQGKIEEEDIKELVRLFKLRGWIVDIEGEFGPHMALTFS